MRRRGEKSFLDKLVSWIFWSLCGIIIFLIFLTLVQCSIKKPSAPTWNSRYNLPLLIKTYDLRTLFDKIDDPALIIDSSGNLGISIQKDIDTIYVRENLDLSPLSDIFKDTIGEIPFISSDTQSSEILLTEIYPGGAGSVPPFSFSINLSFPQLNDLQEIAIKRGIARLKAENHLGLDLDSFSVELIDSASGISLGTVVFESGIPQDSSVIRDFNLSEKSFSSRLSGNNKGHTPGGTILSLADKYIGFSLCFPDTIKVHSAVAKVPAINLSKSQTVELPTENIINSAQIKSGNLYLQLYNGTNLPANLNILLPDLTSSGQPLSMSRYIGALNSSELTIPLQDYNFQPSEQNLRIEITGQTESSGESFVSINSSDSIFFSVSSDTVLFSSLAGIIQPTTVQIEPMQINLDLPQGLSSVSLTDAVLNLRIRNGVGFPGVLDLNLAGEDGQSLLISGGIQPGSPENPVVSELRENNLSSFLNPIPEQVSLTGDAICGDGRSVGTVTENDFITGEFLLSSPFEFVLDSTQIEVDPDTNSLDEDLRDGLNDKVNWAKIHLNLENHLPLGAKVELFFSRNLDNLYTNPDLLIGPVLLDPAETDSSGLVSNPVITENIIQLTKDELDVFQNPTFYSGGKITLPGTNGQKVKFLVTDYIQINSHLELEVKNGG
ncbi:MAG: hypothetical protein V1890_07175 [Candidatus Zixiibacteriota bacterium]